MSDDNVLATYRGKWQGSQARHLARRVGCGVSRSLLNEISKTSSAGEAADRVVEHATRTSVTPSPPAWYRAGEVGTWEEVVRLKKKWLQLLREGSLRAKMTLFWHNHFPTRYTSYRNFVHAYSYYYVLHRNALGNFKSLVRKIGLTPAMLWFLDGHRNRAGNPNENYARELFERFSMGQVGPSGEQNYTEQDVVEAARALTGWRVADGKEAVFEPARHDGGVKVIFGQRGLFRYDDVIDILFEERAEATAHHVCRKLYCFFVQAVPDESFVSALAHQFRAANFEIAPVLKTIFGSAHFYRDTVMGSRIKSPIEFLIGFVAATDTFPDKDFWHQIYLKLRYPQMDNHVLYPPDVGGWPGYNPPNDSGIPGHYTWLDTLSLEQRQNWVDRQLNTFSNGPDNPRINLVGLARTICSDPNDPFRVAVDLAEHFIAVPLETIDVPERPEEIPGDPNYPPPEWVLEGPSHVRALASSLLNGLPHYDWPDLVEGDGENISKGQHLIKEYLAYLTKLPAYQLT